MKKQLTREQTIAEHRKMWNWIAEECLRRKEKVEKADYFIYSGRSFYHFPNNFWIKFFILSLTSLLWPITWSIILVLIVSGVRKELKERGKS